MHRKTWYKIVHSWQFLQLIVKVKQINNFPHLKFNIRSRNNTFKFEGGKKNENPKPRKKKNCNERYQGRRYKQLPRIHHCLKLRSAKLDISLRTLITLVQLFAINSFFGISFQNEMIQNSRRENKMVWFAPKNSINIDKIFFHWLKTIWLYFISSIFARTFVLGSNCTSNPSLVASNSLKSK